MVALERQQHASTVATTSIYQQAVVVGKSIGANKVVEQQEVVGVGKHKPTEIGVGQANKV